jgi:hypothetical protein
MGHSDKLDELLAVTADRLHRFDMTTGRGDASQTNQLNSAFDSNTALVEMLSKDRFCFGVRNKQDERKTRIGATDVTQVDNSRLMSIDMQTVPELQT